MWMRVKHNASKWSALIWMALMGALVHPISAAAQDNMALVIGNQDYPNLGDLPFAASNADQIAKALGTVGFQDREGGNLKPLKDLNHQSLADELIAFADQFAQAPRGSVAFIYFAGHGIAKERRGDVYLLSTDSTLREGTSLETVGLPLADLVQLMRGAEDRTVIIVVDACRNVMPETATPRSTMAAQDHSANLIVTQEMDAQSATTRGVEIVSLADAPGGGWGEQDGQVGLIKRGFKRDRSSETTARADYFIAFSTSPDRYAYDTDIFSSILSNEIEKGRHDLLSLFKAVGERVALETKSSHALQLPTFEAGIYGAAPCFGACPRSSRGLEAFFDCPGCPWMKRLEPGSFQYGSPAGEKGRDKDEATARSVDFEGVDIGVYEVTRAEWRVCEQAGACRTLLNKNAWQSPNAPVGGVTLRDAEAYAAWLSEVSGATYRIPTEKEWEFAARGGANTPFMTGDKIEPFQASYDYSASYGGSRRAEYRGAAETVGSFEPNAFELFDMHGNMWEWACADIADGTCGAPVLRGGSYKSSPRDLRAANRLTVKPTKKREDVGLRVVRVGD